MQETPGCGHISLKARITEVHQEAITYGVAKLSIQERNFIQSIFEAAERPGFTSLSGKQERWFLTIARRLEATRGKSMWEVIAERYKARRR